MRPQLIGDKPPGQAAEHTKSLLDMHEVAHVEIERVDYMQSSVAEARGKGTIGGKAGNLRLRWVRYDHEGNLALNGEAGSWHLAVIARRTYLVDEAGQRLN